MSKALAGLLGDAARQNQFTFIGDSEHRELSVVGAVAQADNFSALQAAGVKHFFMEVPRAMQRDFDNMFSGKITEAQLVAQLVKKHPRASATKEGDAAFDAQVVKMAKLAHDHGMQVWCADHRSQERRQLQGRPYENYVHDGHYEASFDDFIKDRTGKKMPDGSMTTLYTNDMPLAKFVAERAGHEKAAFFYGQGHGGSSYGIDEILGENRTARVDIYDHKEWGITRWSRERDMSSMGITPDKDPPFARYYADTDTFDKFPAKPAAEMTQGDVSFDQLNKASQGLEAGASASTPAKQQPKPVKSHHTAPKY